MYKLVAHTLEIILNEKVYIYLPPMYSMKKVIRTIQIEQWSEGCKKCGKLIVGKTESEVVANMGFHKGSNKCKSSNSKSKAKKK